MAIVGAGTVVTTAIGMAVAARIPSRTARAATAHPTEAVRAAVACTRRNVPARRRRRTQTRRRKVIMIGGEEARTMQKVEGIDGLAKLLFS